MKRISGEDAMKMCEDGLAEIIYTDVLLMKSGNDYFWSLDGRLFEETDSDIVRIEFLPEKNSKWLN